MIAEAFHLEINKNCKEKILLDLYTNLYKFCLAQRFTIEKISTLLSIMYFVVNYSLSNKKIIKERSINVFNIIMDYHCLQRPPYCYEIFSFNEKDIISDFILKTFYRNYTLLENIFKYNLNIYLYSQDHESAPSSNFEVISNNNDYKLNEEFITDDKDVLQQINKIIDMKREKENLNYQALEQIVDENKLEIEKYEEEQMEKLKTFMNTFFKLNKDAENENDKQEKLRLKDLIDLEIKEVKKYLEVKIPEFIIETGQKSKLANEEIYKYVQNILSLNNSSNNNSKLNK